MQESKMWGYRRMDFAVAGQKAFVIWPERPLRERHIPWLWYAPTFIGGSYTLPSDRHEWYMTRCLDAGIAIGGVDVGESWGNPAGRAGFSAFHRYAVAEWPLDPKVVLLGQSRGGLMAYNWAVEHPEHVKGIVGIYPVCSVIAPALQERLCAGYGLTLAQLQAAPAQHSPLERLGPLAAADIPILHIHGNQDALVPLAEHSAELMRRYRLLGGRGELVVIPGKGHEEIDEYFQHPAVLEFILNLCRR